VFDSVLASEFIGVMWIPERFPTIAMYVIQFLFSRGASHTVLYSFSALVVFLGGRVGYKVVIFIAVKHLNLPESFVIEFVFYPSI
jgi:hypothetical protein